MKTTLKSKTKVPINATPKQENQNGIRIRGIPELNDKDQRKRQENDLQQVKEILEQMQIVPEIVDLFRMGQRQEGKDRTILVKVPIWQKRLILSSACRLKTYDKPCLSAASYQWMKQNSKIKHCKNGGIS